MAFRLLLIPEDRQHFSERELNALEKGYSAQYPSFNAQAEVMVAGTDEIQALNREHRQLDEPTDVLSFPTFPSLDALAEQAQTSDILLGSIVICPEKAAAYGESLPQLVHHGLLHLLGFDHETDLNSWNQAEQDVLRQLLQEGLHIQGIPHD